VIGLYRGTTPSFCFKLKTDVDFDQIEVLYVTFKSQTKELSLSKDECVLDNELKTVTVHLTQEQTLDFYPGNVDVQIRLRVGKDRAYATPIKNIDISQILKDGVI
jgi:hypothetical protein